MSYCDAQTLVSWVKFMCVTFHFNPDLHPASHFFALESPSRKVICSSPLKLIAGTLHTCASVLDSKRLYFVCPHETREAVTNRLSEPGMSPYSGRRRGLGDLDPSSGKTNNRPETSQKNKNVNLTSTQTVMLPVGLSCPSVDNKRD